MAPTKPVKKSQAFHQDQEKFLESLRRLHDSLKDLDSRSQIALSHYRQLPEAIVQANELLQSGASLIHGSSTKYTLLGKVDQEEQNKLTKDLLQGCQLLSTGCVLIHEASLGSSRAFRRHVKQASRAIVYAVLQLVQVFTDESALEKDHESLGAQKTGVVWQTCNVILEKQLPIGNRNAMRRDLFTYLMECQETMQEFQQLIDLGPSLNEEEDEQQEEDKQNDNNDDDGQGWLNFLQGQDQQYTSRELSVATASLTLVKISRGSINLSMQACEAIGSQLDQCQPQNGEKVEISEGDKARLEFVERLFSLACVVGDNMTDYATNLYPPLNLDALPGQIDKQCQSCVEPLIDVVLDASLLDGSVLDLPQDVTELAGKLKTAVTNRRQESLDAIAAAKQEVDS